MKKTVEIFRFYSQHGEDFLLWEFFDYKKTGFFIDVGAFDGIHLSNTYSFGLKGWEGICVEPQPDFFGLCKANRPDSLCINAACTDSADISYTNFNVDKTGLFSSIKLDNNAPNIIGHYDSLGMENIAQEAISVKAITLNNILSENSINNIDIDFVSIDVEGCEIDVLRGFDLHIYRPRVLLIETGNEIAIKEISAYLEKFGYCFARQVNVNSFFVRSDNDLRKLQGISLNCVIEKQIHPHGIKYTIEEFVNGKIIYDGESFDKIIKENKRLKTSENLVVEYQNKLKKFNTWLVEYKKIVKRKSKKIDDLNAELSKLKSLIKRQSNESQ